MTSTEQEEYKKEISALRELLGETEFKGQWDTGRKMTMEQAIQLALAGE
jgi:hypothetical protein